jgi:hypothetical protein
MPYFVPHEPSSFHAYRPVVHDGSIDAEVPKSVDVGNNEQADWPQPLMKYLLAPEESANR